MEKSAPDFADGFHASAGTHAQMNSLHSQFVLQTLFAHIDVLGNQVVEAGRIHSTLIEDTQQADATHGEAVCRNDSVGRCEADFDAASTDVDEQRNLSAEPDAIFYRQVHETRFLFRIDDGETNSIAPPNLSRQAISVFGFTNRTGGNCPESADGMFVKKLTKAAKCDQGRLGCLGRNPTGSEHVVAETYRLTGQMDNLVGPTGRHPGNRQSDGITPNVYGGNSRRHKSQIEQRRILRQVQTTVQEKAPSQRGPEEF